MSSWFQRVARGVLAVGVLLAGAGCGGGSVVVAVDPTSERSAEPGAAETTSAPHTADGASLHWFAEAGSGGWRELGAGEVQLGEVTPEWSCVVSEVERSFEKTTGDRRIDKQTRHLQCRRADGHGWAATPASCRDVQTNGLQPNVTVQLELGHRGAQEPSTVSLRCDRH